MPRRSQADRFSAAVAMFSTYSTGQRFPTVMHRNDYVRRLLAQKWTRRTLAAHPWNWNRRCSWKSSTELTALRELAYYLLPKPWGRPRLDGENWMRRESAAAFLLLVQHQLGREAAKKLRACYRIEGVKHYPRRAKVAASESTLRQSPIEQAKIRQEVTRLIAGL